MVQNRPGPKDEEVFRAVLLRSRGQVAPVLLVVHGDRCGASPEPPLLHLPEVHWDVDEVLAAHGWARCGPWWLNGTAAVCEVTRAEKVPTQEGLAGQAPAG